MGEPSPAAALHALGEVYRERRTGVLTLGAGEGVVSLALRDGHVVGIVAAPPDAADAPADAEWESEALRVRPDDSARLKLERILAEVGLRQKKAPRAKKPPPPIPAGELRERLVAALSRSSTLAGFEAREELPADMIPAPGATEPLMLEAVARLQGAEEVRQLLGDLDRRLVATAALAIEERTLTLTEGYILSRIDGQCTARQVLQLVPLDPEETERSLLGLVLTGRVLTEAVPERPTRREPRREAGAPAASAPADGEHIPLELPLDAAPDGKPRSDDEAAEPALAGEGEKAEGADPELASRRREIVELFQALPLRNHFEVLELEPGCSDEDVRRAHRAQVKLYHPDMQRDPRLADLHDVLEAIFIRVSEAGEVLGNAKSRAAYESRHGVRPRAVLNPPGGPAGGGSGPGGGTSAPEAGVEADLELVSRLSADDVLVHARRLLRELRYWEAIRLLEAAMPRLQPRQQEYRGRILLARAYSRNPNWVRKAEETLQGVVHDDPRNVDAHYELGMLYKARGATARAHTMFRKVVDLQPDHKGAAAEIGGPDSPSGGLLGRLFKRGGKR